MISNNDFDFFLKYGYIEDLPAGTSMDILLATFGNNNWIAKDVEKNGLVYGIIKIGCIEFHIYNEKVNGISYRPDLSFPKADFNGVAMPWICKTRERNKVEEMLALKKTGYKKYEVKGPLQTYTTAGADLFGMEEGEHIFIDTEGGVTFLFECNEKNQQMEAYQICKYYDMHKQEITIV